MPYKEPKVEKLYYSIGEVARMCVSPKTVYQLVLLEITQIAPTEGLACEQLSTPCNPGVLRQCELSLSVP